MMTQEVTTPPNPFWGRLIRELRDHQHVSQRQLAAGAGVNRSTLRRIEDGSASGDVDTLESILRFLGHELDAVIVGSRGTNLAKQALLRADTSLLSQAAANHLLELRAV